MRGFYVVLICLLLGLSGCEGVGEGRALLDYQAGAAEVGVRVTAGADVFELTISLGAMEEDTVSGFGRQTALVAVTSPADIAGVCYQFDGAGAYVQSGEIQIPVTAGTINALYAVLRCFCITQDSLVQTEAEKASGSPMMSAVFHTADGTLTAWFDADGMPRRFVLDGPVQFSMDVLSYECVVS